MNVDRRRMLENLWDITDARFDEEKRLLGRPQIGV